METNYTVKVTLSETMENLKLLTSYLGGKRETNPEDYDKVALFDSDAALIALLMEDASLRIAALFPGANLIRWRYYRSAIEFTLAEVPDPEGLHAVLAKAVSQEVLRRWLRIGGSDYADALSAPGDELTEALRIYLPDATSAAHAGKASRRSLPPL